jgi:hypothetical protein
MALHGSAVGSVSWIHVQHHVKITMVTVLSLILKYRAETFSRHQSSLLSQQCSTLQDEVQWHLRCYFTTPALLHPLRLGTSVSSGLLPKSNDAVKTKYNNILQVYKVTLTQESHSGRCQP